jgi:hypothetical protein
MTRFFVQNAHQRQLSVRGQLVSNLMFAQMGEFLVAGCLDAPDMLTPQWDAERGMWIAFDFRDE